MIEFRLKYYFLMMIGICSMLLTIFIQSINHQRDIDKIFDNYYKRVAEIQNGNYQNVK